MVVRKVILEEQIVQSYQDLPDNANWSPQTTTKGKNLTEEAKFFRLVCNLSAVHFVLSGFGIAIMH
jgi:hypothetical protein